MSRRVPHFLLCSDACYGWYRSTDAPLPDPLPAGERGKSDFFRHPQPCRAGAGVGRQLRLRGTERTAGDDTEGCPVAAGADWLLGWADTVFGLDVEERLHQAVFQGMEADRRHTTTGFENLESCLQSCPDLAQLIVDGDADALEGSGRNVDVARPRPSGDGRLHGWRQIDRRAHPPPPPPAPAY